MGEGSSFRENRFLVILFSFLLFSTFFFAGKGGAESSSLVERAFCDATMNRLADRESPTAGDVNFDGCIKLERLLILSNSWPQFVSNFREYMSAGSYPVALYSSFQAADQGHPIDAYAYADSVIEELVQLFVRADDPARGKLYVTLVRAWRNQSLLPIISGQENKEMLLNSYDRGYLDFFSPKDLRTSIRCLVSNDPMIGDVREVVESQRFNRCMLEIKGGQ